MGKQVGKLDLGEKLLLRRAKKHPLSTNLFSFTDFDVEDFEKKTNKNAIWRGKVTKQFKNWHANKPKLDLIKEKKRRRKNKLQNIMNARK